MLESRLQAVASRRITVIYRLKPGLQRLVAEVADTLYEASRLFQSMPDIEARASIRACVPSRPCPRATSER
jgi:hypothetical protein